MAKHNTNLRLNCDNNQSSVVSVVQLGTTGSGDNNNMPALVRADGSQTIQMIKFGNNLYQVTPASDVDDDVLSTKDLRKSRKLCDDGSSNNLKVTYVKTEKLDLNNSYASHGDDEDSAHLADEESSEQPEGSLLNLALATGSEGSSSTCTTIVQGPDGRFFIPVPVLSSNSTSLSRGIVVQASESGSVTSPHGVTEEVTMKRELRLLKNREAARECRRKKKEYIRCLENRVALLENQNKTLINELKSLKEIYCQEPRS